MTSTLNGTSPALEAPSPDPPVLPCGTHPVSPALALPAETYALGSEFNLVPMNSVEWAASALAYSAAAPHIYYGRVAMDLNELYESGVLPPDLRAVRTAIGIGSTELLYEGDGCWLYVFSRGRGDCRFAVMSKSAEAAAAIGRGIEDAVSPTGHAHGPMRLDFWSLGRNGPWCKTRTLTVPMWTDINENYPSSTRELVSWMMELVPEQLPVEGSRLILWHGPPGTGKTYALRALVDAWRSWCGFHIILDPEEAFHDPQYLISVLAETGGSHQPRLEEGWKLVVIEDADLFLQSGDSASKPALDRMLNLCDGIFGQGTRTLVLLTTNMRVCEVPPALIRPGRCLAIVEFAKFSRAEARAWLGSDASVPIGTTLAELFEQSGQVTRRGKFERFDTGHYL